MELFYNSLLFGECIDLDLLYHHLHVEFG